MCHKLPDSDPVLTYVVDCTADIVCSSKRLFEIDPSAFRQNAKKKHFGIICSQKLRDACATMNFVKILVQI